MRTNWAGNISYHATSIHEPSTVDEVRRLVARAGRIRALGTGHTFNEIADTTAELMTLAALPPTVEVDPVNRTATVSSGLRYGDAAARLHRAGFALPNLASLPHLSIPGAIAQPGTYTHCYRNRDSSEAAIGNTLQQAGEGRQRIEDLCVQMLSHRW